MIANKTMYKIWQSISYLTFLLWQFVNTFVGIAFVHFVDTMSIADIISSDAITEVSTILFKYLSFSQTRQLGS